MNARAWGYTPFQGVPPQAKPSPRHVDPARTKRRPGPPSPVVPPAALKPHPHKRVMAPPPGASATPRPGESRTPRGKHFGAMNLPPSLPTAVDLTPNVDVLLGLPAEASVVVREAALRAREAAARQALNNAALEVDPRWSPGNRRAPMVGKSGGAATARHDRENRDPGGRLAAERRRCRGRLPAGRPAAAGVPARVAH